MIPDPAAAKAAMRSGDLDLWPAIDLKIRA